MNLSKIADLFFRRINSILFRLLICVYSIFIVSISNNFFPIWFYPIFIAIYLISYSQLLKKHNVRLVVDFIFLGLILLYKKPDDPLTFVFILLPIINSVNFSGEKKSKLLYLYTIGLYLLLHLIYFKCLVEFNFQNIATLGVPILCLWFINLYTEQRIKFKNFKDTLTDLVDEYFLNPDSLIRPYKIYEQLIAAIHSEIKKDFILDIYCFVPSKTLPNRLILVNGSSFLWKYDFKNPDIGKDLIAKKMLVNEPIFFDNKNIEKSIMLCSKAENQDYYFVFVTKSNLPLMRQVGFSRLLAPVLTRISKILYSDSILQEIRNNTMLKLMESLQYVQKANKTMHFIRNRLGPFANLLAMLDVLKTVPSDIIEPFHELLSNEKERTENDLKKIIERANNMLDKGNNPLVYTSMTKLSIQKLFMTVRRIFNSQFPDIDIELNNIPEEKLFVAINEDGIEEFLSDWISNMSKYKRTSVSCSFFIEGEKLKIYFRNDHNLNKEESLKIISDLISNDRNEIIRRTTHGLFIIKTILEEMGIPFEVRISDYTEELEFILTLKIIK